jgi:hypothetical protein
LVLIQKERELPALFFACYFVEPSMFSDGQVKGIENIELPADTMQFK